MQSLAKGDVLLYDLLMPGDGQLLLPAGTVLDDDYIFKILKMGEHKTCRKVRHAGAEWRPSRP